MVVDVTRLVATDADAIDEPAAAEDVLEQTPEAILESAEDMDAIRETRTVEDALEP